jgi:uncharacterized protein HemX
MTDKLIAALESDAQARVMWTPSHGNLCAEAAKELRRFEAQLAAKDAQIASMQQNMENIYAGDERLREALQSVGLARSLSEANRMIEEFFGELGEQT